MEMKIEMLPVPVTDIERAMHFYVEQLGFNLDHDIRPADHGIDVPKSVRCLQLTPPGSDCSILVTCDNPGIPMRPGAACAIHLCVQDIEKARDRLIRNGIDIGEAENRTAIFHDPDGNEFWLQQKSAHVHDA
jgi:predicted enzyme related to lactoylglutathione lyase